MLPVIAIIGRANVGKSTLFNRLTRSDKAIVDNQPGVTRDRQYGYGRLGDKPYLVVDTGGLFNDDDELQVQIDSQVNQIFEEADSLVFMVDGVSGITQLDFKVAEKLRDKKIPIHLIVNKSEGKNKQIVSAEFHELGIGHPLAISAKRGDGVSVALEHILADFPNQASPDEQDDAIRVAVVGRPNVGKSTLINRLAGDERVIVMDKPNTTRDSIDVPITIKDQHYVFIDTAGVRKRTKLNEKLEKLSVIKTMKALHESHIAILMLDASQQVSEQDSALAGLIDQSGRALVVLVNKWDGLDKSKRVSIRQQLDRKFNFLAKHQTIVISALHGSGLGNLPKALQAAHRSAFVQMGTGALNRIIKAAVSMQSPPIKGKFPAKLKFAHQGGKNPPRVIIHGNSLNSIPASYRRYLGSCIENKFKLIGTRVEIEMRQSENPYDGR